MKIYGEADYFDFYAITSGFSLFSWIKGRMFGLFFFLTEKDFLLGD